MAGIVSADKSRACPCPCFSEFRAGNCAAICSARTRPPKHDGNTPRRSSRLISIAPRLRALVLITIFKFRPTCARPIRLNGRVISVDTLACARVRERAWFTHESYESRGPRKRLLAKHSTAIAISRADNSLLGRIRHASVVRVAVCRYSDRF